MMKPHYFGQDEADADDMLLGMAKMQGYVPQGCLLGGVVVMAETNAGRKACWGCNGPRERCGGSPKKPHFTGAESEASPGKDNHA
jgi:hypothetical protein